MMDSERFRVQVVHGWAFRNHPANVKDDIRKYLETGDPESLPDLYKRVRASILPG